MCEVCDKLLQKQNIMDLGVKKLDFGVLGEDNKLILKLVPYCDKDSNFCVNLCTGICSPQHNFPYLNTKIKYCPFCGKEFK